MTRKNDSILNDGWADDVSLIYPKDSWKPDPEELTSISHELSGSPQEFENTSESSSGNSSRDNLYRTDSSASGQSEAPAFLVTDPTLVPKKRKSNSSFRLIFLLWIFTLCLAVFFTLQNFYDFLVRYQEAYDMSRPELAMEKIIETMDTMDLNSLYHMITSIPEVNGYESQDTVKACITRLLEEGRFSYEPTENYQENVPEYYIYSMEKRIGTVTLRKKPDETLAYQFPVWYISSFVVDLTPSYVCNIIAPSNCMVWINGIPISASDGTVSDQPGPIPSAVPDCFTRPDIKEYSYSGFYEIPVVTATNAFGEAAPVDYSEETGTYTISYGYPPTDLLDRYLLFSQEACIAYVNALTKDVTPEELSEYFIADSVLWEETKALLPTGYFRAHQEPQIQILSVTDTIYYNENQFSCTVNLRQYLTYRNENQQIDYTISLWCINTDEGWKICHLESNSTVN
ncbi:MAG: hypothetical protein ACI4DU_02290 [Lachnospiraceae bacterium]